MNAVSLASELHGRIAFIYRNTDSRFLEALREAQSADPGANNQNTKRGFCCLRLICVHPSLPPWYEHFRSIQAALYICERSSEFEQHRSPARKPVCERPA